MSSHIDTETIRSAALTGLTAGDQRDALGAYRRSLMSVCLAFAVAVMALILIAAGRDQASATLFATAFLAIALLCTWAVRIMRRGRTRIATQSALRAHVVNQLKGGTHAR